METYGLVFCVVNAEWRFALLIAAMFCYIVGAVPVGYLIGRRFGVDLLNGGSMSSGMTNLIRLLVPVIGKKRALQYGALCFFLDALKGALAYFATYLLFSDTFLVIHGFLVSTTYLALAGGVVAVLGHCFSLFVGFRGGKGVATTFGVVCACQPLYALAAFLIWVAVLAASRYVSAASIVATAFFGALELIFQKDPVLLWIFLIMVVLLILKHIPNIIRLIQGKESKFGNW